ncbi:MAG: IS4 family transposase [Candidatus Competibacteraceae bacterium]|nr:MAG: IS4 family transposase [Candidatus Competibacteraceae bacterium]
MLHHHFHWNRARISCIVYLIIGIIQMGTVNLAKIAVTFPGRAQPASHYKRLQRLFCQFSLDLNQVARFIASLIPVLQFKLTLDRTNWKYGDVNINYLVLGVVYRGSAFPILWVALDKKGNSNTQERIALMNRFLTIFGPQMIACLFADREFIGIQWFGYLIENQIKFAIRIKKNTQISNSRGVPVSAENLFRGLPRGSALVLSGQRTVWGHSLYVIGLKMANGEFVILATQEQPETALETYKERWPIETLFICLKTRGFDLESTHITDPQRLEKWMAFLAIAFSWAHIIGEWRHEIKPIKIKKHGRPTQSLFRYGLDYLRSCLFHHQESARQYAFHQALESLFKRLGSSPQNRCFLPLTNTPPGRILT